MPTDLLIYWEFFVSSSFLSFSVPSLLSSFSSALARCQISEADRLHFGPDDTDVGPEPLGRAVIGTDFQLG